MSLNAATNGHATPAASGASPPGGAPASPAQTAADAHPLQPVTAPVIAPVQPGSVSDQPTDPPATQAARDLLDRLGDRIDTSTYESDDEFLEDLSSYAEDIARLPDLQRQAELGQRYQQHASEFEQFLASRSAPRATQRQPEPARQPEPPRQAEAPKPRIPQIDPLVRDLVDLGVRNGRITQGEGGLLKSEDGMFADAVQQFNTRELQRRRFVNELSEDPERVFQDLAKPAFQSQFDEFRQQMSEMREHFDRQIVDAMVAPHYDQLYQADGSALSAAGNQFNAAFEEAGELSRGGKPLSTQERVRYALAQCGLANVPQRQPASAAPSANQPASSTAPAPTNPPENKRETFVQRALAKHKESRGTPSPSRAGVEAAVNGTDMPLSPEQDLRQIMVAEAKAAGLDLTN